MKRKLFCCLLAIMVWHAESAVGHPSASECTRRLTADYQEIDLLFLRPQVNIRQYRIYQTDANTALQNCPPSIYPIKIWSAAGSPVIVSHLYIAILAKNSNVVAKLVRDPDQLLPDKFGQRPLEFAAHYGSVEILKILLGAGVPIDAPDIFGNTALMEASGGVQRDGENTQFLASRGADIWHVSKTGYTPLTVAIISQDIPAVKYLLAHGALKKKAPNERDPEMIAKSVGNKTILGLLDEYNKSAPPGTQ